MIKRRQFMQLSMAAASLDLLGLRALQAQQSATVQSLAANTALFSGTGGNVLACKAGNGELLVVDGGLHAGARALRETIENTLEGRRITTLVNTHWHPEQTGLNEELGNRNTRIFAHENTRQWLSTPVKRLWEDTTIAPLPESARPNDTFYHYGDFQHDDVAVEYGYLRQAHTDGDMYVFLPQANVLHAGGVIATDGWPFMDWWTGGWIGGVADAIETLLSIANENTQVVPATGPITDRAGLIAMRDMYADIYEKVRTGFSDANTAEQTVASKPAAAYEARYGSADSFIELSHWSLIPHLTPDA
ncbi:MAG TPA: MBL fold metallo-hydrolase [Hyphomicrobiales bacterium]|nr:MBL fold metallo-hydrolase [Hyphomicrobiales bacterium]